MKLADKPCYPQTSKVVQRNNAEDIVSVLYTEANDGLTFRERLIIALASNSNITSRDFEPHVPMAIIKRADAIIKELENAKQE